MEQKKSKSNNLRGIPDRYGELLNAANLLLEWLSPVLLFFICIKELHYFVIAGGF